MTRASACLRVFTPPASSRALSRSPARALLASYHHHPHPSLGPLHVSSILRIRPSPSSQPLLLILLTSDASFSRLTLSTRFTYPRRVLPILDAFYLLSTRFIAADALNPPSTRISGPQRVFLILAASSLAYPGHDLSMACQRASRTGTTSTLSMCSSYPRWT